jgi:hypothetical protein
MAEVPAAVAAAIEAVGAATIWQGVIAYTISLFASTALEPLLSDLSNVNTSIHMMIISVTRPALLSVVIIAIIEVTTFDVLPVDSGYDIVTDHDPQGPTEAMEYCKYESNAFVRNVGSVVVFFWFSLWVIFIFYFLARVSGEDKTLIKLKTKMTWLSVLSIITSNGLQICVGAFITIAYTDKRDGPFYEIVNVVNAGIMMVLIALVPVIICCTYKKKKWDGYEVRIKKEVREN